jgi:hypothetical protein
MVSNNAKPIGVKKMSQQEFTKALILSISRMAGTRDPKVISSIMKENGEMVKKATKMIAIGQFV